MAHTFTQLHYHCVFGTLGRRNVIGREVADRIHDYIGGIVRNIGGIPLGVNGTGDHAHVICTLRADLAVAEAVKKIKANSSGWIHKNIPSMADFAWQEGYGAFTVSRSALQEVIDYVGAQKEHHKKMTFEEEYLMLLKKHHVEFDPRYVWG